MEIRKEIPTDHAAILEVTRAAFSDPSRGSRREEAILAALWGTGTMALSLVAEEGGRVLGHVAFSPVTIGGRDLGWLGLGPLAVAPPGQGRGLGSALIRAGLAELRARGVAGCVVLGQPDYYRRFGFEPDPALYLADVPPGYFLRLALAGPAPAGEVRYQPAFH